MTMSSRVINLSEFFNSSSLISRQAARELFDVISKTTEEAILLDFLMINFASRSFFDEFNSKMSSLKLLGKKVEFVNLNVNVKTLFEIVIQAAQSKSSPAYASVANVRVVNL